MESPISRREVVPKRGELYVADFEPIRGSEIGKIRPALIVQNDTGNHFSSTIIVAAVTSLKGEIHYPTEVLVPAQEAGLPIDSIVRLDQLRTMDKTRLGKKLGRISGERLKQVDSALRISLGLVDI